MEERDWKNYFLKNFNFSIKPEEGKIFIDNKELNDQNIDFWHSKIGYVSQNTTILDDNLVFNITLSNSEIDYDYLKNLIKNLIWNVL